MAHQVNISVMDVRRVMSEYILHYQNKYETSFWKEEKEGLLAAWQLLRFHEAGLFDREASKVHLTVSALIYHAASDQVLMNLHKRHRQWKHFGGHIEEADRSLLAALAREIKEETGLSMGRRGGIIDPPTDQNRPLDICLIGNERHLDIDLRYLLLAHAAGPAQASDESEQVRWVPSAAVAGLVAANDPCGLVRLTEKAKFMLGDHTAHQRAAARKEIGEKMENK